MSAHAQARDFADASDRLVSRIAQQAAPRVATLMGKPPMFEARAPGLMDRTDALSDALLDLV